MNTCVKEFAEEISKLAGVELNVKYQHLPENDPQRRHPDITIAKEILDWEPKVDRAEGLRRTYEYFKDKVKTFSSSIKGYRFF